MMTVKPREDETSRLFHLTDKRTRAVFIAAGSLVPAPRHPLTLDGPLPKVSAPVIAFTAGSAHIVINHRISSEILDSMA